MRITDEHVSELLIPRAFAEDRKHRELPLGEGRWVTRGFIVRAITPEELSDLKSDAELYATSSSMADFGVVDFAGLIRSAQATLRRIGEWEAQP